VTAAPVIDVGLFSPASAHRHPAAAGGSSPAEGEAAACVGRHAAFYLTLEVLVETTRFRTPLANTEEFGTA
jgi:hypothetical protein